MIDLTDAKKIEIQAKFYGFETVAEYVRYLYEGEARAERIRRALAAREEPPTMPTHNQRRP